MHRAYRLAFVFVAALAVRAAGLGKRNEALDDLRRAIELDPKCRDKAKTDEDFANLREDPEFRKLVGLDEV
jgi:hypothetical protein